MLDTAMPKQKKITQMRHELSYKQLGVTLDKPNIVLYWNLLSPWYRWNIAHISLKTTITITLTQLGHSIIIIIIIVIFVVVVVNVVGVD